MKSLQNTPLIQRALEIMFQAHKYQKDKAGQPYVFHPYWVALQLDSEDEICTALLHDVIEDSDVSLEDLKNEGFSEQVLEALSLLTHDNDVDYFDYIEKLSHNDLARVVKQVDLLHNSDISRIANPSEDDFKRLEKYQKALHLLSDSDAQSLDRLLMLFSDALGSEVSWLNVARIARLVSYYFGKRFVAGDAASYIFHYARSEGYDIPPYPLSSSGEIKKFLADEQVSDLSDWYVCKNITQEGYSSLYGKTIVEIRRMNGQRKVFLYPKVLYKENVLFKPLAESGFIEKSKPADLYQLVFDALDWIRLYR